MLISAGALLMFAAAGCDTRTVPVRDGGPDGAMPGMGCTPGAPGFVCEGNVAIQCLGDGTEAGRTNCNDTAQICVSGTGTTGCRTCRPGSFQCSGDSLEQCNPEGTGFTATLTCDSAAGQTCNSTIGACTSPCDDAVAANSYIGCEYWPTTAANLVDESFSFAVAVANPQSTPVDITVTRNGAAVPGGTVTVPANGLSTINLPWVMELKDSVVEGGLFDPPSTQSALVRGGAYRLVSTLPVTVYQFSPLEYSNGTDFSFSNDASLLLPTHVLTGNYIAVAERTQATQCDGNINSIPGFVTIVGVSATPVTVNVTLAGNIAGGPGVTAANGGTAQSYTLNQGDVLQLASASPTTCTPGGVTAGQCGLFGDDLTHCDVPDQFDLTGTDIRASGPVMVLGGHTCAFLPFNRFACDHIEESVFPLETWGDDFIVSATEPIRGEPNIVRIISGTDNNAIVFDPAVTGNTTLNRGQVLEFETTGDFRVSGSGPLTVGQFLVGQNYAGSVETEGVGDPAMSFAIPTEQFRTEYTFLAPSTFEQGYVNVTAPAGATVTLDGTAVGGWRAVGASGFQTARVPIAGGQHVINGGQPFGIVVYGFGSFTSYMYPGGLDFEQINPLI
ncbi:MAG: IgGFc-binding protein [Sandaracinaceae bacterium]